MSGDLALFPAPQRAEPEPALSADRRRTLRQRAMIDTGQHPLTKTRLHPDAPADTAPDAPRGRAFTCGSCRHRVVIDWGHARAYPKCDASDITFGAGSDCRGWWPACELWLPEAAS